MTRVYCVEQALQAQVDKLEGSLTKLKELYTTLQTRFSTWPTP